MRKILLLLGIFFMCALTARGQGGFTTVTGTITGPIDGIVWSCATISAQLITAGGVAPTLNGGGFTTSTSPVSLGCPGSNGLAPGSFSIRLADSGVISPSTTTWQFTVNMAPGIAPPAGTGPQSFTYTTAINCSTNTPSVCTANSMSISAQLSALAPRLSNAAGGGGITQVATLPGTCTAGSQYQLTVSPYTVYICGPANTFIPQGPSGGTFGASPSSGYTFTSTPITTNPFSGNLLIGANINAAASGTYTAGAGYTLTAAGTATLAAEYATAASATSYSAPFTYSVNSGNWGGTIATFSSPGNNAAFVQGKTTASVTALAYTSNNGVGNLLVAVFRYSGTPGTVAPIASIADTATDTWVSAGARCFEGYAKGVSDGNYLEVWYSMNSKGGANTVTATMGAGTTGGSTNMAIAEFSGIALTSALVDYNFTGSTTGATSIPGATTNTQYLIQAINNAAGTVDFSGRDAGAVFRSAGNARASTGGTLYFKNGIYPGQTSVQETLASQTNWYIWGIPGPVGTEQVSFHVVCESFTQILYSSIQTDGCIHLIMPSAYAGPQPSSNTLSGFWQRPTTNFGSVNNNSDFFVNNAVRIPDNQHTPSNSFDTFTAVYSSHIGAVADTAIPATDQLCSGLTTGLTGVNGFRTNQTSTDETYFENTWAEGYTIPYNILSNHFIFINAHASCNFGAGTVTMGGNVYGGIFIHFQDIHNLNGFTWNCTQPGTRIDSLNQITEFTLSGTFNRNQNTLESAPGNCVGQVTTTTQATTGAISPGSYFVAGSGANYHVNESVRLLQVGLLTSSFTSAATTGLTKQTLATYTFPYASSSGPFQTNSGAVFEIVAWGITAANGNAKTVEIDFGGTTIATITSTVNAGTIRCKARIIVSSVANTQEVEGECDDGTTRTVTRTAPGITGTAAIITNIAATTGTAIGDFTFKGLTIEYVGGN